MIVLFFITTCSFYSRKSCLKPYSLVWLLTSLSAQLRPIYLQLWQNNQPTLWPYRRGVIALLTAHYIKKSFTLNISPVVWNRDVYVDFRGEDKISWSNRLIDADLQTIHGKHFYHLSMFLVSYCMVLSVKNAPVICVISVVYVSSLEVKTLGISKTNKTHLLDTSNEVTNNCFLFPLGETNSIWTGTSWEKINNRFSDVLTIC